MFYVEGVRHRCGGTATCVAEARRQLTASALCPYFAPLAAARPGTRSTFHVEPEAADGRASGADASLERSGLPEQTGFHGKRRAGRVGHAQTGHVVERRLSRMPHKSQLSRGQRTKFYRVELQRIQSRSSGVAEDSVANSRLGVSRETERGLHARKVSRETTSVRSAAGSQRSLAKTGIAAKR